MAEPKPVLALLIAEVLALGALAGWYGGLTSLERRGRLGQIRLEEQVSKSPPEGLFAQGAWLYHHRVVRLRGMVGLMSVAAIIGVGEGSMRRRTDVLGGFLLRWWTLGVVALALLPGVVGAYLIAPWPLPADWVASALAGIVGVVMYGLMTGRPYVA
jgi:hypothetical protein